MVKKEILKEKHTIGVYIIFGNNGKIYVGSSKDLKRRLLEHFNNLIKNKHENPKLQNYVNKHGISNLKYCVAHDNLSTVIEARTIERQYIRQFNTFKNGFNCTDQVLMNDTIPENIRKIISEKAKLRQTDPSIKIKLSIQNSGSNNPMSKLTIEDVTYIRSNFIRVGNKISNINELATKFNISAASIRRVINYETYK